MPPISESEGNQATSSMYKKFNANTQHNSIGSPYLGTGNGRSPKKIMQRSYDVGLGIQIPKKVPNLRMSIGEDINRSY